MRGNAPNIKQEVEDVLVFVKGKNPTFTAAQIRNHIKNNPRIFKLSDNQIPGERSIQARLKKPENHKKIERIKNSSLDKPWNLGVVSKYKEDFPPEILPVLFKMRQIQNRDDWEGTKVLTIRHAQWIARLYNLINEISSRRQLRDANLMMVWMITDMYAIWESWDEFEGKKGQETTFFDEEFFLTEHFWEMSWEERIRFYAINLSLSSIFSKELGVDTKKEWWIQ